MTDRINIRFRWYDARTDKPKFDGYFMCYNERSRIMWIGSYYGGTWTGRPYSVDKWAYCPPKPDRFKRIKDARKVKNNESHNKTEKTVKA